MHNLKENALGSQRELSTCLTILVDDNVSAGSNLVQEHGFAVLVERGPQRILFDTGQGRALENNAATLQKDLSDLNFVILSHGHYDHTGGLLHAVKMNPGIRIVSHPALFSSHMKLEVGKMASHSVGIPCAMRELEELGASFQFTAEFRQVCQGVWFTGYVPRVFKTPPAGALITENSEGMVPDSMEDDASLVIETSSGFCVLLGCAHAGLRNILEHVRVHLGIDHVHAVIGGTHLGPADREDTLEAIRALEEFKVQLVAPTHCTGSWPSEVLRSYFGTRYCEATAGTEFVF
ncbi:MAG: MBL fold metallo-hydrolase [Desulfomonilaceae bacterium]